MEHGVPALWRRIYDHEHAPIRTFHLAWMGFFVCLTAWMGLVPVISSVQKDMHLTNGEVSSILIATVALAIVARPLAGWFCDLYGPRKTFGWLLILGSIPVVLSAFAWNYESLLVTRALVGLVGASFVTTVYHTSMMFAPNVIGQANATATGWGNLGAASVHAIMPVTLAGMASLGMVEMTGWRLYMILAGKMMLILGIFYLAFTQDTPAGNFTQLRELDLVPHKSEVGPAWRRAAADRRIWALFVIYAACVGLEIAVISFGGLYFMQVFNVDAVHAGFIIAAFGLMNIFARTLGGVISDRLGGLMGLSGRTYALFGCLVLEGIALLCFSQAHTLQISIGILLAFSLFTQMAEGATYGVTPFLKRGSLGAASGITAAGGTCGALLASFLLKDMSDWDGVFWLLGLLVIACSFLAFLVRFSPEEENAERVALAACSFRDLEKKIDRVKKREAYWACLAKSKRGLVALFAALQSKRLKARVIQMEDLIDEGRSALLTIDQFGAPRRRLKIVWDAAVRP